MFEQQPRLKMFDENTDLFADETPIVLEQDNNKLTCKTCKHRQRWDCNTKVIQYCGVQKSKRTNNGLLKIKAKNKACFLYKPET